MILCGIDPGLTGALAFLDGRKLVELSDMPVAIARKHEIDVLGLVSMLSQHAFNCQAIVERQQAMPKQGVTSSFRNGSSYGALLAVLAVQGWPVTIVSPREWKQAMHCSSDKNQSLEVARRLFPGAAQSLTRKKDHGRAEALLIAEYGRRKLGG